MTRIHISARDRIVEAAATVWAADPSATLDVVAQRAGVGRATLHRHFPSRAALIRTAALEGIAALAAALDAATLGVCQRSSIIGEGTVMAAGSAEEILANPRVREVYLG
ncbi:TetR family transcriptional regulator, partial [Gemmatimonas sp.]|uniref:TetR/AcrR family transcriptional regulator n=1 Tax=Gemmatimonas sp. TaxID=1962908 RepID=UPI00391EF099